MTQRPEPPPPLVLDAEQRRVLHRITCQWIAAATSEQAAAAVDERQLGAMGDVPVVGAFVTLRKAGELRGCIGNFAASNPLGRALSRAARGVVSHDPRFPPVLPEELDQVTVELSLLHSRELLGATAGARRESIILGTHGLDIQYAQRSGLLLPQVPLEFGWSVDEFLAAVCRKAGLPTDTWQHPEAALYRFAALHFGGPFGC